MSTAWPHRLERTERTGSRWLPSIGHRWPQGSFAITSISNWKPQSHVTPMPVSVGCAGSPRDGESIEVQGRYRLAVDDGNAYLAAGLAGLGILWLPHCMSKAHLSRGELVPLFEGRRMDPMPMHLAFPPNRHVSAKRRVFVDWVTELTAQHAPIAARRTS
jgi:DNA-binding transcriptional LysR family regulator